MRTVNREKSIVLQCTCGVGLPSFGLDFLSAGFLLIIRSDFLISCLASFGHEASLSNDIKVAENLETSQVLDEAQNSEQKPGESGTTRTVRDEAILQCIKMTLECLPSYTRQKPHVDILRYVFITIFDKCFDKRPTERGQS
ncbi:unnamed protein product [Angiostrongylus costaricensis]|uniref:Mon2_C domain-containing protein n=1 Tax=Angiostrongylus costaricensis TaxID=334426 RepID=A0A0R3PLU0_ANGCS|nr:unnamed protein product [Angiostrongylus costaricensis]